MVDRGNERYAVLEAPGRIWAVGSVQGEARRLRALHRALEDKLRPGDRLIYLGNLLGVGGDGAAAIDEVLRFRRLALMLPGAEPWDVVVLRGAQEEMWQKLLLLQFAVAPSDVLEWMLGQGLETTLAAYGGIVAEARHVARQGPSAITRWTSDLRDAMHTRAGHETFMATLRRFAVDQDRRLLFVAAGLDPDRPLDGQGDRFWWGGGGFDTMRGPYGTYLRVVRGHDSRRRAPIADAHRLSLDGGAGFGGPLIAECLDHAGASLERLTT